MILFTNNHLKRRIRNLHFGQLGCCSSCHLGDTQRLQLLQRENKCQAHIEKREGKSKKMFLRSLKLSERRLNLLLCTHQDILLHNLLFSIKWELKNQKDARDSQWKVTSKFWAQFFFYWFGNLSETSNTIMLIIYKDEPLPQLRHSCT